MVSDSFKKKKVIQKDQKSGRHENKNTVKEVIYNQ